MVNIKNGILKSLYKIPAILGCLLFLCSMILPFHHLILIFSTSFHPPDFISVYYWSFKSQGSWFFDFWFTAYPVTKFGLSWVFITMFMAQVLTLATGIGSIFINRRILSLFPAIICPIVTALMIYTGTNLRAINLAVYSHQQGYWLTYPSIVLFIINFLLETKLG